MFFHVFVIGSETFEGKDRKSKISPDRGGKWNGVNGRKVQENSAVLSVFELPGFLAYFLFFI